MTTARRRWTSRRTRRPGAPALGIAVVLAGMTAVHAQARPQPVTGWIRHHAAPLTTIDPAAPRGDRHARQIVSFYVHYSLPQPPARTCAAGTARGTCRSASPSTTAPSASAPGRRPTLPPPAPGWFEQPFGRVGLDQFALDLDAPAPAPARRWLEAPIRTRGLPDRGPNSSMSGGTLAQWFDVIVHRQELTPTQPA